MIKEKIGRALNQLFDWAKSWDPKYVAGMYRGSGGIVNPLDDPENNVKSIKYTLWAYLCIKKISENIAGLPIKFYEGYGDDQKEVAEGPVPNIIHRPSPDSTYRDLWVDTVSFLITTGKAAWSLDEFTVGGQPVEGRSRIKTIPAHKIRVKTDTSGYVSGYVVSKDDGTTYPLRIEQVAYFKTFNPEDPFNGLSPMTVAEQTIETDYYARDHNKEWLKSGCAIGTMLQTDKNMTEADVERIKKDWRKNHRGYMKWKDVDVLFNNLKIVDLKNTPKDIEFPELIKLNREEIIALFGGYPAVFGLFEYANYANAKMQLKEFWGQTLIPILLHIQATMNELIIPRWTDKPIWMEFDISGVKALQEDFNELAKAIVILKRAGVITPNEARIRIGYDPLDDEAADTLDKPTANPFAQPGNEPPEKSFQIKAYDKRPEQWAKKESFRRRHESKFMPVINEYFDKQKDRIIKELKTFVDQFPPQSVGLIFDELKETDILVADINPAIVKTYKDSAAAGFEEVENMKSYRRGFETKDGDIIGAFDVTDPEAIAFIERHGLDAAKLISGTTQKLLQDILTAGYDEGLSIKEIAKLIEDKFSSFPVGRSYTIAQTEMGNAVNSGTFQGYKQAGAEKKSWLATPDERTRDSHWAAGQVPALPLNESFPVGSSLMMYPNDPVGAAEEIINCRCTLLPEVEV
jgi:HK97 family phage portal protein